MQLRILFEGNRRGFECRLFLDLPEGRSVLLKRWGANARGMSIPEFNDLIAAIEEECQVRLITVGALQLGPDLGLPF